MDKIIDINKYRNMDKKYEKCEWDIITDVFYKVISEKNLSKDQVGNLIKEVEKEVNQ